MFPLFRLDRLSIDNVLSHFESSEIFELSLCSKATFNNIKGLTKEIRNRHSLAIDIHNESTVHVEDKNDSEWSIKVHNISKLRRPIEYTSFRIIKEILSAVYYEDNGDMNTYWVNEHQGFKLLIEHLTELYNLPLDYIYHIDDNKDYSDGSTEILDWINERQVSINSARAQFSSGYNQENFDSVLDRLKSVEELTLDVDPTDRFIQNHQRIYEFKSLIIEDGYWVTLPRLLTMNCVELEMYGTKLSDTEANLFLKFWMCGSFPRLKRFRLRVKDLDFSAVMSDLPCQVNEERLAMLKTDYPYYLANSAPIHCDIRRLNGTIATVFSKLDCSILRMRVWD